jgi:hypothetical protein
MKEFKAGGWTCEAREKSITCSSDENKSNHIQMAENIAVIMNANCKTEGAKGSVMCIFNRAEDEKLKSDIEDYIRKKGGDPKILHEGKSVYTYGDRFWHKPGGKVIEAVE